MPFVDRIREVNILKRILDSLFQWWIKIIHTPPTKWDESFKIEGFSFIVCGAASGIGKSTFARKAFVEMLVCS
jgi:hypothetical protein